jgi:hypothetical protein
MEQPQNIQNILARNAKHHKVATFAPVSADMQSTNSRAYLISSFGSQYFWPII